MAESVKLAEEGERELRSSLLMSSHSIAGFRSGGRGREPRLPGEGMVHRRRHLPLLLHRQIPADPHEAEETIAAGLATGSNLFSALGYPLSTWHSARLLQRTALVTVPSPARKLGVVVFSHSCPGVKTCAGVREDFILVSSRPPPARFTSDAAATAPSVST